MIADGRGRPVAFALAPGQAHELPQAPRLMADLSGPATWTVADRGYSSHGFRRLVADTGSHPVIPAKRNELAPAECPDWACANRNIVERMWARLKEWRAVATRYEKTAASFLGVLCLAATKLWIRG